MRRGKERGDIAENTRSKNGMSFRQCFIRHEADIAWRRRKYVVLALRLITRGEMMSARLRACAVYLWRRRHLAFFSGSS